MLGYKYNTEEEVKNLLLLCDNYYGYPKENCITEHSFGYYYSELDNFYYVYYDESLEIILGIPIEIEITEKIINPFI